MFVSIRLLLFWSFLNVIYTTFFSVFILIAIIHINVYDSFWNTVALITQWTLMDFNWKKLLPLSQQIKSTENINRILLAVGHVYGWIE